ncbi:hypothetical protein TL16_g12408 [Triparma laevis f. inornata]|uniref:Uncharacterized protein n=1 Tax=Triparma laevis f. inornata TaxID=1714386 RepID=A0A9W7EWC4_9STRA|nr:hypothetical protein TL16_g12408 [Triparma laevis f. inornata]
MGSIVSSSSSSSEKEERDSRRRQTVWKKQETKADIKARFIADGSLPADVSDEYVELRQILAEPVCQRYLGDFAKKQYSQEAFFGWIDIQEYRSIPTPDYRRSKLTHIYKKYIKADAILNLGSIDEEDAKLVLALVEKARTDKTALKTDTLDKIQHKIFMDMFKSTFIPFKGSGHYTAMKSEMNDIFNKVTMDDFDLFEKIGEGGFAKVIRVRKKSTGKYYALKVQRKKDLVEMYLDDPKRLETEKTVFASCHHPFIVDLDYSLQTDTCALLVLGLANAGNLQDVINAASDHRVPLDRVVFYSAELVLGLSHLHDLKMMYRDLKPSNVLLCEDGHIQLADMGGVADCGGSVLSKGEHDPRLMKDRKGKGRRRSIMGTHGYMAPEMVKLLGQKRYERVGYTEVIDYWSLGITIFKLLSGKRPFDKKRYEKIVEETGSAQNQDKRKVNKEYEMLRQEIEYPTFFSSNAKSVIQGLLEVDEEKRLGSNGTDEIKKHPFFTNVDWDKLVQKHVIPPLRLFDTWDFISPHTLKVEMGIAGEMEAHDTNFKIQQVMGTHSPIEKRASLLSRILPGAAPKEGNSPNPAAPATLMKSPKDHHRKI